MNYNGLSLRLGIELLCWTIVLLLLALGVVVAIKLRTIRRYTRKEQVILELTPPPSPHNTLKATEEFFTVLGQVISLRSWRELVNGRKASIALEVVSTRNEGIRYLVRMSRHDQPIFLHNLAAFAPTVVAEKVTDYLGEVGD